MPIDELKNEQNEVVETACVQTQTEETNEQVFNKTNDAEVHKEQSVRSADVDVNNDVRQTDELAKNEVDEHDHELKNESPKTDGNNEMTGTYDKNNENNHTSEENMIENEVLVNDAKHMMTKFEKKKRITKIASRAVSVIVWIIGLALLYLCFSNLYQQLFNPNGYTGFFGIGNAVVASNSMNPEIYKNDLIFYKEIDGNDVCEGDVIVYHKTSQNNEDMLVVHQVIDIGDGYVTTQGLANAIPDESFPVSSVIGKYVFKIGKVGFLLNMLSTDWAPLVIVAIMILIIAIRIAVYFVHKKNLISKMSNDINTRNAINHFFDI